MVFLRKDPVRMSVRLSGRLPLVYLLYGTALFFLLIVIFFPYRHLTDTLITRFENRAGVDLIYRDLGYIFPAGCSFDHLEIIAPMKRGRISVFKGDLLSLNLSLLPLFKKELNIRFQANGFGGDAAGEAALKIPIQPEMGTYHLQIRDIQIEEIFSLFYMRNFKVNGSLTGQADVQLVGKEYLAKGTGTLLATLSQGMVRNILVQGMELPDFAFESIEVEAKLEDGKLKLKSAHLDSEILWAEFDGEVELNSNDLRDSSLILSARLKPVENDPINLHGVASFYNKTLDPEGYYPFQLRGTFRLPKLQ
jgi:type II secretion system protein N